VGLIESRYASHAAMSDRRRDAAMATLHEPPAPALGAANGIVIDRSGAAMRAVHVADDGRFGSSAADAGLLDAGGALVLPGFVDAHEHLRSFAPGSRGSAGLALPDLLARAARASTAAEAEDYRALSALASARLAAVGVTSAIDHIYPLHRPRMLQAAIEGHHQVGVRTSVAVGIMTKVPDAIRAAPEDIFDIIDSAADSLLPSAQLFVAPVSLRQTDLAVYRAAVEFATRRGLRLYTHISESLDEVEECLATNGVRPVQLLEEIGFLRPGTVLVHCVHLDDADIAAIARSGAAVVYCPTNHLWLAKGVAPVLAMLAAGIPVCLGLDGMGDPFAEVRQAMFAQGSAAGDPGAISTDVAYDLGTRAGAEVFGAAGVTGTIEPGGAADYITVPMTSPELQPMADPLFTAVRHATGAAVRDVVVAGRPIVRDGQLVHVAAEELIDRAWHAVAAIAERAGGPPPRDWRSDAGAQHTRRPDGEPVRPDHTA
jgi:5-methylthioadenosine/S-adenosylhomocysteine deaminase